MPSVHRDPRGKSQYWFCAFTLPNGQRAFRSTKETERNAAQAACFRMAGLSEVLEQAQKLENKELVLESFISVTRQAARGELSEATARKLLDDILQAAGQGRITRTTTKAFLTSWLSSKEVATAAGTARRYRDVVEPFLASLGPRADLDLSTLTSRDVEAFRNAQLKAGKSNKTANMVVKTLRIALNLARRQGLTSVNVAEAVENLPENSAERGTFTPEQLGKLVKAVDEEWRGMILLGACAGLRISDAAKLTWGHIDLDGGVIRFTPQKTRGKRKKLEIPILPDLEAYLKRKNASNASAPLFPKLTTKKTTGSTGLSNTFARLIEKAGIHNEAVSEKSQGKGRAVYRYGFHSLRHTFVSLMANVGVSKELRMKLAGHTSSVHDRYTHHELETFRSALVNFPSFVG